MVEKELTVRTADGEMPTFAAHPDGDGPFPVAVLYMDGVGYREQVKENARRFAAGGFYCVAPDLFYRSGTGLTFDMDRIRAEGRMSGPEGQRLMQVVSAVKPEGVAADTKAIFNTIATDPAAGAGPKVCVGYCMGARMSLHAASAMAGDFVAAAGIHPDALLTDKPNSPHHELSAVRGELLFAFAEIDRTASAENVDQFRAEMQRTGVKGVVERWPGVAHGFAMADLAVYDHDAAEKHFARTLDLWRRNLGAQGTPL